MKGPYVFSLGILLVLAPKLSLQQQCSSTNDLGQTECVNIPIYTGYQWATCLTGDYIIRASDERHQCASDTASQCWYQCMIEIYGAEEGSVNSDCSCTPGEMLPNDRSRLEAALEAERYSPSGDDCDWYEDCLEMRYPCSGMDDGCAIEYAENSATCTRIITMISAALGGSGWTRCANVFS